MDKKGHTIIKGPYLPNKMKEKTSTEKALLDQKRNHWIKNHLIK